MAFVGLIVALTSVALSQDHWPENRGPQRNYHLTAKNEYPKKWSIATDKNIRWRLPLPETGHSGIAVWGNRLFLTCFRKLTAEDNGTKGTWVSETRGYCLAADTGKILWSIGLPGQRPNQVNGTFTDSTTPTPVTDGNHVWFVNAGGFMACHNMEGKRVWEKEFTVLDLATGETVKRIRIRDTGSVIAFDETSGRYKKPADAATWKSRHLLTHRTNIGVGQYHFFMGGRPGSSVGSTWRQTKSATC